MMRCGWCGFITPGHSVNCIIKQLKHTIDFETISLPYTIKPSGNFVQNYSLDFETQMVNRFLDRKKEQPKMVTMTRRFYVGSANVSSVMERDGFHSIVKTLPEALAEATTKVEDGNADVLYVVEIVKVVRRVKNPNVIVEDVRR